MNHKHLAILGAIIGNSIFGFSFLFSKIALSYVSPVVLLAIRFDIAFLMMSLLLVLRIIKVDYRGKDLRPLFLLGLLQPIIYFLCENYGLNHSSSSIAGVIIAVIPVASFFTGFLFLHETFGKQQLVWALVSLAGVSIISLTGQSEGNLELIGLILLLGAVIAEAIFNTVSRSVSGTFSSIERTYLMFLMGAIFFTGMAIATTRGTFFAIAAEALHHLDFWTCVLYLGAMSSIAAFLMLNYAVSYLPVRQAASFTSLTSPISVLAGLIFLHESVSLIQILGILLILFGVYKVNTKE